MGSLVRFLFTTTSCVFSAKVLAQETTAPSPSNNVASRRAIDLDLNRHRLRTLESSCFAQSTVITQNGSKTFCPLASTTRSRGIHTDLDYTTLGKKGQLHHLPRLADVPLHVAPRPFKTNRLHHRITRPLLSNVREHLVPSAADRTAAGTLVQGSGEASSNFDVVVFRSRKVRSLFKKMLSMFQCPDEKNTTWSDAVRDKWHQIKTRQMGKEAMLTRLLLPVFAMKGTIPCASAFYSEAQMNDHPVWGNTFILYSIIANKGNHCRGAGAAILCYLIRNSRNKRHEFSPLKLVALENEPELDRYYKSFGCVELSNVLLSTLWNVVEGSTPLVCYDERPEKCEQYVEKVFDADQYFESEHSRYAS